MGRIHSVVIGGAGSEAGQTELAVAAAGLSSGETVDFSGRGMTTALLGTTPVTKSILEFSHKGYWCDITRTIQYVGGSDYNLGVPRHIKYDDAANLWSVVDDTLSVSFAHAYEHMALNTLNGDMYFRLYNSDAVYRRRLSIDSTFVAWETIDTLGGTYQDACALEFHPGIGSSGGLVYCDGDWGTHVYDIGTQAWTEVSTEDFAHPHNGAAYLPAEDVCFVGGGNTGGAVSALKVRQVNASKAYSSRADAPHAWGPSQKGPMIADPGPGGKMLLFAYNDNVYEYTYGSDSWAQIGTHPFYSNAVSGESMAVIPIPRYGVVMGISEADPPVVTLWKR